MAPRSSTPQGYNPGLRSPPSGGQGDYSSTTSQGSAPRSPRTSTFGDYSSTSQGAAPGSPRASGAGDFGLSSQGQVPRSPRSSGAGDYGLPSQGQVPRSPRASGTGDYSGVGGLVSPSSGLRSPQSGGAGDRAARSRSPAPDFRRYERQAEEMIARSPRYATPERVRMGSQTPSIQSSAFPVSLFTTMGMTYCY